MRKATLFAVLLAANVMAQTTNPTITPNVLLSYASAELAAPDGGPGIFAVSHQNLFCDTTCTTVFYSFCLNQAPGCQEGLGYLPDSVFTGNLTTSYLKPDKLHLKFDATASPCGLDCVGMVNFICYAFDQYGDCTDETIIPGDAGPVDITFTKTAVSASVSTSNTKLIANGRIQSSVSGLAISSSATASGSALGIVITAPYNASASVALDEEYSSNKSLPRVSDLLRARISEAARRRLEMLELRMMKP